MRELLGIAPPSDREGVLQDIHWPTGAFGYFPCYTLGALMAAQLFEALRAAQPDLEAQIGRGDFRPLLAWLRANIHEQGSLLDTPDPADPRDRPPAHAAAVPRPPGAPLSRRRRLSAVVYASRQLVLPLIYCQHAVLRGREQI